MGFPIRRSPDQSLFSDSPGLIAASHVLRRLPAPRHPLHALSSLTIKFSQDKKIAASSIVKEQRNSIDIPNLGMIFLACPPAGELVELAGIEPATSGLQNRRSPI